MCWHDAFWTGLFFISRYSQCLDNIASLNSKICSINAFFFKSFCIGEVDEDPLSLWFALPALCQQEGQAVTGPPVGDGWVGTLHLWHARCRPPAPVTRDSSECMCVYQSFRVCHACCPCYSFAWLLWKEANCFKSLPVSKYALLDWRENILICLWPENTVNSREVAL